jgi:hypothetical protein
MIAWLVVKLEKSSTKSWMTASNLREETFISRCLFCFSYGKIKPLFVYVFKRAIDTRFLWSYCILAYCFYNGTLNAPQWLTAEPNRLQVISYIVLVKVLKLVRGRLKIHQMFLQTNFVLLRSLEEEHSSYYIYITSLEKCLWPLKERTYYFGQEQTSSNQWFYGDNFIYKNSCYNTPTIYD